MTLSIILAVGGDPIILSTRSAILHSAGYLVRSACNVADSMQLLENTDFDLLLLCHSVPLLDRERLIRFVRSIGSHIPIYAVAPTSPDFDAGHVDGVLSCAPDKMIRQLGKVSQCAQQTKVPA